jgi:hypothetical protein
MNGGSPLPSNAPPPPSQRKSIKIAFSVVLKSII